MLSYFAWVVMLQPAVCCTVGKLVGDPGILFLCIVAPQAVAMAAVSELNVLQQAATGMQTQPSLAPASTQPVQCQMLPVLPPMQASAAAAGNVGLVLAVDGTLASWHGSCSSAAATCLAAGGSAGSLPLPCMLGPADGLTHTVSALPVVSGQHQQQVLLPEPSFVSRSGSLEFTSGSCMTGLGTATVAPAAVTAATGGLAMLSSVPLHAAAAVPQVLLTTQPVPAWPNPSWQQLM
jgi:hypothetical protein